MPGTSETIVRSAPISALKSDDLPTFGRPRIATRIASSPTAVRASPLVLEPLDDLVEQVAGAVAVHARERERVAEAEPVELERERLLRRVVDLVREHEHRLVRGAEDLGELLVAGRDPGARVDDEEHEVGLADRRPRLVGDRARDGVAARRCRRRRCRSAGTACRPTRRRAPCGRASCRCVSWTTAARVAVSRLISVDLPTFGKPTIATVPSRSSSSGRPSSLDDAVDVRHRAPRPE